MSAPTDARDSGICLTVEKQSKSRLPVRVSGQHSNSGKNVHRESNQPSRIPIKVSRQTSRSNRGDLSDDNSKWTTRTLQANDSGISLSQHWQEDERTSSKETKAYKNATSVGLGNSSTSTLKSCAENASRSQPRKKQQPGGMLIPKETRTSELRKQKQSNKKKAPFRKEKVNPVAKTTNAATAEHDAGRQDCTKEKDLKSGRKCNKDCSSQWNSSNKKEQMVSALPKDAVRKQEKKTVEKKAPTVYGTQSSCHEIAEGNDSTPGRVLKNRKTRDHQHYDTCPSDVVGDTKRSTQPASEHDDVASEANCNTSFADLLTVLESSEEFTLPDAKQTFGDFDATAVEDIQAMDIEQEEQAFLSFLNDGEEFSSRKSERSPTDTDLVESNDIHGHIQPHVTTAKDCCKSTEAEWSSESDERTPTFDFDMTPPSIGNSGCTTDDEGNTMYDVCDGGISPAFSYEEEEEDNRSESMNQEADTGYTECALRAEGDSQQKKASDVITSKAKQHASQGHFVEYTEEPIAEQSCKRQGTDKQVDLNKSLLRRDHGITEHNHDDNLVLEHFSEEKSSESDINNPTLIPLQSKTLQNVSGEHRGAFQPMDNSNARQESIVKSFVNPTSHSNGSLCSTDASIKSAKCLSFEQQSKGIEADVTCKVAGMPPNELIKETITNKVLKNQQLPKLNGRQQPMQEETEQQTVVGEVDGSRRKSDKIDRENHRSFNNGHSVVNGIGEEASVDGKFSQVSTDIKRSSEISQQKKGQDHATNPTEDARTVQDKNEAFGLGNIFTKLTKVEPNESHLVEPTVSEDFVEATKQIQMNQNNIKVEECDEGNEGHEKNLLEAKVAVTHLIKTQECSQKGPCLKQIAVHYSGDLDRDFNQHMDADHPSESQDKLTNDEENGFLPQGDATLPSKMMKMKNLQTYDAELYEDNEHLRAMHVEERVKTDSLLKKLEQAYSVQKQQEFEISKLKDMVANLNHNKENETKELTKWLKEVTEENGILRERLRDAHESTIGPDDTEEKDIADELQELKKLHRRIGEIRMAFSGKEETDLEKSLIKTHAYSSRITLLQRIQKVVLSIVLMSEEFQDGVKNYFAESGKRSKAFQKDQIHDDGAHSKPSVQENAEIEWLDEETKVLASNLENNDQQRRALNFKALDGIKTLKEENKNLQIELQLIEQQKRSMESLKSSVKAENDQLLSQVSALEGELKNCQAEKHSLQIELLNVKHQLNRLSSEEENRKREILNLKETIQRKLFHCEELEKALDSLATEKETVEQTVGFVEETLSECQKEKRQLEIQVSKMESEIETLKIENENATSPKVGHGKRIGEKEFTQRDLKPNKFKGKMKKPFRFHMHPVVGKTNNCTLRKERKILKDSIEKRVAYSLKKNAGLEEAVKSVLEEILKVVKKNTERRGQHHGRKQIVKMLQRRLLRNEKHIKVLEKSFKLELRVQRQRDEELRKLLLEQLKSKPALANHAVDEKATRGEDQAESKARDMEELFIGGRWRPEQGESKLKQKKGSPWQQTEKRGNLKEPLQVVENPLAETEEEFPKENGFYLESIRKSDGMSTNELLRPQSEQEKEDKGPETTEPNLEEQKDHREQEGNQLRLVLDKDDNITNLQRRLKRATRELEATNEKLGQREAELEGANEVLLTFRHCLAEMQEELEKTRKVLKNKDLALKYVENYVQMMFSPAATEDLDAKITNELLVRIMKEMKRLQERLDKWQVAKPFQETVCRGETSKHCLVEMEKLLEMKTQRIGELESYITEKQNELEAAINSLKKRDMELQEASQHVKEKDEQNEVYRVAIDLVQREKGLEETKDCLQEESKKFQVAKSWGQGKPEKGMEKLGRFVMTFEQEEKEAGTSIKEMSIGLQEATTSVKGNDKEKLCVKKRSRKLKTDSTERNNASTTGERTQDGDSLLCRRSETKADENEQIMEISNGKEKGEGDEIVNYKQDYEDTNNCVKQRDNGLREVQKFVQEKDGEIESVMQNGLKTKKQPQDGDVLKRRPQAMADEKAKIVESFNVNEKEVSELQNQTVQVKPALEEKRNFVNEEKGFELQQPNNCGQGKDKEGEKVVRELVQIEMQPEALRGDHPNENNSMKQNENGTALKESMKQSECSILQENCHLQGTEKCLPKQEEGSVNSGKKPKRKRRRLKRRLDQKSQPERR